MRRLTQLAGELLGIEGFAALECTFKEGRCFVFVESNGDTVVLRPAPGDQPAGAAREAGAVSGARRTAVAESVRASLATLKDVAGITGSFVCTPDGRLVSREIPAVFDDGALVEAGSRLMRLRETFAAGGDELEVGVIRFRDHRIYMKAVGNGMLLHPRRGASQHARAAHGGEPGRPAHRAAVAHVEAEPPPAPIRRPSPRRPRTGPGHGPPGHAPLPRPRRGLSQTSGPLAPRSGESICLARQAISRVQGVRSRTMALRMVSSFRMQATRATLGSLPEALSRAWKARMMG